MKAIVIACHGSEASVSSSRNANPGTETLGAGFAADRACLLLSILGVHDFAGHHGKRPI